MVKKFFKSVWDGIKVVAATVKRGVLRALEFVQGPKNEYSSKRLFGLGCFVVSVVLSLMALTAASATGNAAIISGTATLVAIFMGSASAVFVAAAASGS